MLITGLLYNLPLWYVGLLLILGFALLYFSLATGLFYLFKWGVNKGVLKKVIAKPYFPRQIRFEIIHSLGSIVIFGLYGLLIVFCFRNEIVDIDFTNSVMTIILDLIILAVWNEIHFYLGHKLMHTRLFLPIHRTHHKSVIVTPFSTYSFNPIESLIFGTVMILPMLVYDFEVWALIIFPVYHLFFNIIGHSNTVINRENSPLLKINISTRHNDHHSKFNLNFGFVSRAMDWLMKTNKNIKSPKKK